MRELIISVKHHHANHCALTLNNLRDDGDRMHLRWMREALHGACLAIELLFLCVWPAKSQLAQLWYCEPRT